MKLICFDNIPVANGVFYGGDAGAKDAVLYENNVWMLKYPKTTRDMVNPQISYTTSPLSEYLGSNIYTSMGFPVHDTLLGVRNNKMVVACKDFTRSGDELWQPSRQLIHFHYLKNSFMASDLESYSGSGSETLLDEVLAAVNGQINLRTVPGVTERFWDMFVVDAFIGNNDRNNGNWGLLLNPLNGEMSLAPVYDNGNAFFNKSGAIQMEKHLNDINIMTNLAYKNPRCVYKYTSVDGTGERINPFVFIKQRDNPDCTAAAERFLQRVDMKRIQAIIEEVPETYGALSVMPAVQKEFYLELLRLRLEFLTQAI
ncbi:MAG: CtkA family protein [Defluviitaleaceae bacterium]|nr:CtkA family protein [Defluviitaleaceae bacterium]